VAEQFIRAWSVDAAALDRAIGGCDRTLVQRALDSELAEELHESAGRKVPIEEQLDALVRGAAIKTASWNLRRTVMLLADAIGTRIDNEPTLPGRGWQFLAPAWARWGLTAVAKLWSTAPPWANRGAMAGEWPHLMIGACDALATISSELGRFDPRVVSVHGVPPEVPRFGEGEWPMHELGAQLAELTPELAGYAKAASGVDRDLIVWLDGQQ
jgi:hypothetical protein